MRWRSTSGKVGAVVVAFAVVTSLAIVDAGAGGSWMYPVQDRYEPGDSVTLVGYGGSGSQGSLSDGPFYGYLYRSPNDDMLAATRAIPLPVGEVEFMRASGSTRASITFDLPDYVTPGRYFLDYCNEGCDRRFGDLIGAIFWVGQDPEWPPARSWPADEPEIVNLADDALIRAFGDPVTAREFRTSETTNSTVNVPLEPRTGAAVVWTGTEVIVSGGFAEAADYWSEDKDFLTDSAAYDPESGTWRVLAESPVEPMTWPSAVWTGEKMIVIGAAGGWSFDPSADEWASLPELPFPLPDLVRDNERFEVAWSGQLLYVWRPSTNDFGFYDPNRDRWQSMPGPSLDAFPARLLADESRLVALGTAWPSAGRPVSYEVAALEWADSEWEQHESITFVTDTNRNIADVGAAALVDGQVVVWGDHSDDVGPTQLLAVDGTWSTAPSMPLNAGTGHPGSVHLDDGVMAFTEGADVAMLDLGTREWTVYEAGPTAASGRQSVWTGSELLTWTGSDIERWAPPE